MELSLFPPLTLPSPVVIETSIMAVGETGGEEGEQFRTMHNGKALTEKQLKEAKKRKIRTKEVIPQTVESSLTKPTQARPHFLI